MYAFKNRFLINDFIQELCYFHCRKTYDKIYLKFILDRNDMVSKNGVDIKKELELLEKKVNLLIKSGKISKGEIDIIAGNITSKEALFEINKEFEKRF